MGRVFTGFACGMWFVLLCLWTQPTKGQVGFSYFQLNEMKKECEKSLPRDKVCKAEIKFVIQE